MRRNTKIGQQLESKLLMKLLEGAVSDVKQHRSAFSNSSTFAMLTAQMNIVIMVRNPAYGTKFRSDAKFTRKKPKDDAKLLDLQERHHLLRYSATKRQFCCATICSTASGSFSGLFL